MQLALLTGAQVSILTFLTAFIGIKAAKAIGLKLTLSEAIANAEPLPPISKTVVKKAVFLVLLVGLILMGADRFYFQFQIPLLEANPPGFFSLFVKWYWRYSLWLPILEIWY